MWYTDAVPGTWFSVLYYGRTVRFICKVCFRTFRADPGLISYSEQCCRVTSGQTLKLSIFRAFLLLRDVFLHVMPSHVTTHQFSCFFVLKSASSVKCTSIVTGMRPACAFPPRRFSQSSAGNPPRLRLYHANHQLALLFQYCRFFVSSRDRVCNAGHF